jgi:hypothetical protein
VLNREQQGSLGAAEEGCPGQKQYSTRHVYRLTPSLMLADLRAGAPGEG